MTEQPIKSVQFDARVIRKDGTVEDLGTVAYWHESWWMRLRHRIARWLDGASPAGSIAITNAPVQPQFAVTADPHPVIEDLQAQIAALQTMHAVRQAFGTPQTDGEQTRGMLRAMSQAVQTRMDGSGKTGWMQEPVDALVARCKTNLEAGQYADAAAYAGMLIVRQHLE